MQLQRQLLAGLASCQRTAQSRPSELRECPRCCSPAPAAPLKSAAVQWQSPANPNADMGMHCGQIGQRQLPVAPTMTWRDETGCCCSMLPVKKLQ